MKASKKERELVENIHSYIDLAITLIVEEKLKSRNDWTYQKIADLCGLSTTTIRNLCVHEGDYTPNTLTLARLGKAADLSLTLLKSEPVKRRKAA